jgi:hypothetical protein
MVGHSKGSAVIDVWTKNHPDWQGKTRLYATPYEDPLGKEEWKDRLNTFNAVRDAEYEKDPWKNPVEKWLEDKVVAAGTSFLGLDKVKGMQERGETRITDAYDPVTMLDNSARVEQDPDWWKNADKGFGHDYHNIASRYSGFEGDGSGLNHEDRPGGADPNYATLDNTSKNSFL